MFDDNLKTREEKREEYKQPVVQGEMCTTEVFKAKCDHKIELREKAKMLIEELAQCEVDISEIDDIEVLINLSIEPIITIKKRIVPKIDFKPSCLPIKTRVVKE